MNSRKEAMNPFRNLRVNNRHFSLALRSLAKGGPRRSLATRLGEAWAGGRSLGIMVRRILVLAVLTAAAGARADGPWYVATNGADTGGGLSWSDPFASISNAIAQASSNDIINVSNGVYTLAETVSNVSSKACKIRAASTNPADTALLGPGTNGWPNVRGVEMAGAGSTLEGFTVTNFCLTADNVSGAGVSCSAGIVSNCIITGNTLTNAASGFGAGLYVTGNGVVDNCLIAGNRMIHRADMGKGGAGAGLNNGRIRNCRIVGNTANVRGGGVFIYNAGDVVQDSVVASNWCGANYVGYGGGIDMFGGGIVSNCQVFSNYSDGAGGGIAVEPYNANLNCRIERCVISNNRSSGNVGGVWIIIATNAVISRCEIVNNWSEDTISVGGLYARVETYVQIRNCLVANNWANVAWTNGPPLGGGGMCVNGTNSLIENCTIVSNTLTRTADANWSKGAGLYTTNGVRVVNSIIYYNIAKAGTDSNYYTSADCTFSNSCAAPLAALGSANIDVDPQFVARETGNYHLRNPSPCVNTGMNQDWMTNAVDLDLKQRIRYGTVDMGTYETIYDGTICNFW